MALKRTGSKAVVIAERRSKALQIRKTGATLEAVAAVIAEEFGNPKYDRKQAFQDIDESLRELNETCSHSAEEYRRQELERLEEWLNRLETAIERGDEKAIGRAIQISDRRCKLLGLDAPIQLMVQEQAESQIDEELRSFLTSIQSLLSADAYREVMDAVVVIGERSASAGEN
jgi:PAS domain-containing protein